MQMLYLGSNHAVSSDLLSKLLLYERNGEYRVKLFLDPEPYQESSGDGFDMEYEEWFGGALHHAGITAVVDASLMFSQSMESMDVLTRLAQRIERSLSCGVEYVLLCPEHTVRDWVISRRSRNQKGGTEDYGHISYYMSISGKYDSAFTVMAVPEVVSRYSGGGGLVQSIVTELAQGGRVKMDGFTESPVRRVCLDDIASALRFYLTQPSRQGILVIPGSESLTNRNLVNLITHTMDTIWEREGTVSYRDMVDLGLRQNMESRKVSWWLTQKGWCHTGLAEVEVKSIVAQTLAGLSASNRRAA